MGDFYESLQNMGVLKTNDKIEPVTMQRKVDYTRQAMVKYQQSESTVTNSCSVIRIR